MKSIKKQSKGIVLFSALALFILYLIFIGKYTHDPSDEVTLFTECQILIKNSVVGGTRFSDSFNQSEQNPYRVTFPFELEDAVGTWTKVTASCDIADNNTITHLTIGDKNIF
ncbi:hypothetical protein DI392_02355 [Vibrio albus]|uniref:Uncharacterized protein n=1 Tax=Vibrio albus TaxID=2200953 RepID=A0A2U3BEF1_9VIBR|nr:hypothetical protein [Vibrio albus]PWI35143.1 hypothetical protein DI392_02355 [Vibrio albus]